MTVRGRGVATFVDMIVVLGLAVVLQLFWSAVFRNRQGTPATE